MKIKKLIFPIAVFFSLLLNVTAYAAGYGQGRNVNDENVPYGAIDFNSEYKDLNAYAYDENSDKIVLTFDQGYENGYTSSILDTLKEKNVKAVFFLTGDYAKKESELVKRMIDEGHVIGNHGMKHLSLPTLSREEMVNEISSLHDFVKETYGYEMTLFRPPCGEYSDEAIETVNSLGYKTILWSFAYADWDTNSQPEKSAAFQRVTEAAHKGAFYLLHSVSKTNCEILPDVIDTLRANGYEFSLPNLSDT